MRIAIIYGGQSVEHDVSVLTALHLAKNIPDTWKADLIYLTRDGSIMTSGVMGALSNIDYYIEKSGKRVLRRGVKECYFGAKTINKRKIDAVINCCHGGVGEDGRLAGMFDVLRLPVTSCGSVPAWNLQSKSRTREILGANGFAQPRYVRLTKKDVFDKSFPYPVIVKPDTLGSSIGISVARDDDELSKALELAFELDNVAVVEQFLENAIEINCAAIQYGVSVNVSGFEKMSKNSDVFDFDAKYLDTESGFIKKSGGEKEDEDVLKYSDQIKKLTRGAYEIFGCSGVVRADFLIANNTIYLNEMNTVPGFMAYHLWHKIGLPYTTLIEIMMENAMKIQKNTPKTCFKSEILGKNRVLV